LGLDKLVNKIKLYYRPYVGWIRPAEATSIQPGAERSGTLGTTRLYPFALKGQKH